MITPEEFKRDVLKWAEVIGVKAKEIHLRKMKRKWASCSSKGRLTFDINLLKEEPEVRHRIIVHELLHLRYPNHGKMMKVMQRAYLYYLKGKVRL